MQVFIKNMRLCFKGFLGFLCFGNPCWRAQLYLSEERFDRGTWWGGYTYTLQMVSFYESWNCVWWHWLSIKRAPSAICSNRKWFGQMLTSFEMTEFSPDKRRCSEMPSAHVRPVSRWRRQCPHLDLDEVGDVMSSRDSLSTLTAFFHSHLPWLLALISLEERSTHTLLSTGSLRTPALW